MPNTAEAFEKQEGHSLRLHIIAAFAIYAVDALFFGQGVVTFLIAVVFGLMGIVKTLTRVKRSQPFSKIPLQKAGIYLLCFVAVISTIVINNKLAKNHAEVVILAVKQFKVKYNHYPDSLQELVPEFLPSVPLAKYSFAFNDFIYTRGQRKVGEVPQEHAMLLYVSLPPFGRPTYNFERDSWGYID